MKNFKLSIILFFLIISGCASDLRIANVELETESEVAPHTRTSYQKENDEIRIFLSFSGGGTRAAALSYGVLEALRDTTITAEHEKRTLLSEVDVISAVSGGSFTAAYYGLYGDQIFEDYEQVFLKKNVQKNLVSGLLNPLNWFKFASSNFNRTELAINYYDKSIFKQKTFADFRKDMPFIQINATDLSSGQQFIFEQEYFNLLCSDLSQFQVARAVTASSAVPLAFAPIAIKNYDNCDDTESFKKLKQIKSDDNFRTQKMKAFLQRYADKEKIKYVHLIDGGISDNLGIRALYDTVNLFGSAAKLSSRLTSVPPKYIVLILVNASVSPEKKMDQSIKEPALSEQLQAVTDAQIDRYSAESIQLLKDSLNLWATQISQSSGHKVKPFFIQVDFDGLQDKTKSRLANAVSTSLALPDKQVDGLRNAGKDLLNQSPEFKRLLNEIDTDY